MLRLYSSSSASSLDNDTSTFLLRRKHATTILLRLPLLQKNTSTPLLLLLLLLKKDTSTLLLHRAVQSFHHYNTRPKQRNRTLFTLRKTRSCLKYPTEDFRITSFTINIDYKINTNAFKNTY
jgi:hypothetical protein